MSPTILREYPVTVAGPLRVCTAFRVSQDGQLKPRIARKARAVNATLRSAQPFTAPEAIPLMMYFCSAR
jgi:hypothetical protein